MAGVRVRGQPRGVKGEGAAGARAASTDSQRLDDGLAHVLGLVIAKAVHGQLAAGVPRRMPCDRPATRPQGEERLAECPPDAGRRDTRAAAPCELRPPARLGLLAVFRRKLRVAIDIRFNAKAHSLPASRSPSLASPIITLAIGIVARSLRSINPSWPKAASNAADMLAMSSGPKE
jgi:hypothetical protein